MSPWAGVRGPLEIVVSSIYLTDKLAHECQSVRLVNCVQVRPEANVFTCLTRSVVELERHLCIPGIRCQLHNRVQLHDGTAIRAAKGYLELTRVCPQNRRAWVDSSDRMQWSRMILRLFSIHRSLSLCQPLESPVRELQKKLTQ